MVYAKTDDIRRIFLHHGWVLLSLIGVFFFFFVLNRGGVDVFFWSGSVFLLAHLLHGDYTLSAVPLYHRLFLGVCLGLVMVSLLFAFDQTDSHRVFRIVKMVVIVFCIHFVRRSHTLRHIYEIFGVLLAVSIIWQFLARTLFGLPYGTWSNPHYLANFSILSLPLVFYYFRTAPKPWRYLFLLLLVIDIDPVFRNSSRPAFSALIFSTLFVIIFFTPRHHKLTGLGAIGAGLAGLAITNYAGFLDKAQELITTISNEERVHIWSYSLKMLQDSSPAAWIVGNGIGHSANVLPSYAIADPVYKELNFPHNFLIQLLYDSGIIGSVLVFGGLALLLCLLIKSARTATDDPSRLFINCMMAVFLNSLIFTCLTVGFYSKYTLYPLGFIIGTVLALADAVQNGS